VGSSVVFECNNECGGSVVGYVLEEFVGWNFLWMNCLQVSGDVLRGKFLISIWFLSSGNLSVLWTIVVVVAWCFVVRVFWLF